MHSIIELASSKNYTNAKPSFVNKVLPTLQSAFLRFRTGNVAECTAMDDEFDIECSDEEFKDCKGPWEPPAEEIIRLYNLLDKDEIPELQWKCPGYRSPSPEVQEEPEENKEEIPDTEDKSDFDFMDEVTSPKLKIRKDGEDALKGSAKKKTTSLDGVISNMRRHNLLPPSKSKIKK